MSFRKDVVDSSLTDQKHTLDEIGRIFNVTRERTRQIQLLALRKLKASSQCENMREYLS